jgi:hypothetical protein
MNRKEFIQASARWFLSGTLLALTGFLASRKSISRGTGCRPGWLCSRCTRSGTCTLPEYQKYLEDEKEKKD